jgi:phosphoribosylglycinamide formyltransferase-1
MAAAERQRRVVFLCSGGGGNLRFMHVAIVRGWIRDAQLVAVVTDRPCPANTFADAVGIPNRTIDFKAAGQGALLSALAEFTPDLVVTTVHRILHDDVVRAYRGRLLNLHYSLLPAFGGAIGQQPLQAALAYGVRFAGVTAHEVDETLDGGRPIVQAVFPVQPGEEVPPLMNLVFRCGCLALLAAARVLLGDAPDHPGETLELMGRPCTFSARLDAARDPARDESFWKALA